MSHTSTIQTIPLADIRKQIGVLQVAERFFDSAVLFALAEVGVFELLSSGPRTFEELQRAVAGDEDTLRATLDAGVAVKVLFLESGRYAAREDVLDCLGRKDSAAYLGEWMAFLRSVAGPLFGLGDAIRTGVAPASLRENGAADDAPGRHLTAAMNAYARTRGVEFVDWLDFSGTRRLLDLGCGPGTYAIAIVERHPSVHVTLLDMPEPISQAKRLAAARGVGDRLDFVAMDARDYEPEKPFDTILLSNALHMMEPAGALQLLERCFAMLEPGGRLILQAQYLNNDRVSPRWPTLVSLILRVVTPDGRNHALAETREWMESAGFRDVQHVRFSTWNTNSCLIGSRPA